MGARKGLAKVGFIGLVCAAISAPLAPLPASAIAPVGMLVLVVTDCKTGAPIRVGEAIFAANVGAAVVPIENGVVGPVGLGPYQFVLNLTSPGYRVLHRVLHGTGAVPPIRTIPLCLHPVAGSPEHVVTTTYAVDITCSPASGQVCEPPFATSISSADILQLQFTAASTNCSTITVDFSVDGFIV